MLLIKNGKVLTMGPQGVLEQADVLIFDGMPAVDTDARNLCTIIDGKIVYQA